MLVAKPLYLIEILHQTTTLALALTQRCRCILSKFYIKPQPSANRIGTTSCCILSKFYIKPQLRHGIFTAFESCILSKFYIKPQLLYAPPRSAGRCILSKFYIKPQLFSKSHNPRVVVSYRNSTSNHNYVNRRYLERRLYLIEILHQTTTPRPLLQTCLLLYLIEILHQTTTSGI